MYRPTVRYDDVFRDYVDSLFRATHLDRNQIIRGALFAAAHSEEFQKLLEPYKKGDVPLPSPLWKVHQDGYWLEQSPQIKGEGKDVNVNLERTGTVKEAIGTTKGRGNPSEEIRRLRAPERPSGEIPSKRIAIKEQGGISFTFN